MLIIEITDIRVLEDNSPIPKVSTSGKASIISRMAKMGQSILPKIPLPSTTDSEDTEVYYCLLLIIYIHKSDNYSSKYCLNLRDAILFCRMMYLISLLVTKRLVIVYRLFMRVNFPICKNNIYCVRLIKRKQFCRRRICRTNKRKKRKPTLRKLRNRKQKCLQ